MVSFWTIVAGGNTAVGDAESVVYGTIIAPSCGSTNEIGRWHESSSTKSALDSIMMNDD